MEASDSFRDLIRRMRSGDPDAAAEVVSRYESAIRRSIRLRMRDGRLNAAFDSADVCQSVMLSFFVRVSSGEYDLESPEQILHLLLAMARNKLAMQVRRHQAQRRDVRRSSDTPVEDCPIPSDEPSPSQRIITEELIAQAYRLLSLEEQGLVTLRREGLEWTEIAERLGGSAEALRKKLSRALDRVCSELGLIESA